MSSIRSVSDDLTQILSAAHAARNWEDQPRDPGGEDGGQWVDATPDFVGGMKVETLSEFFGGADADLWIAERSPEGDDDTYVALSAGGDISVSTTPPLTAKRPDDRMVMAHLTQNTAQDMADAIDRMADDADGFEPEGEWNEDLEIELVDHEVLEDYGDIYAVVGYSANGAVVTAWPRFDVKEPDVGNLGRDFHVWVQDDHDDARAFAATLREVADLENDGADALAKYDAGSEWDVIHYSDHTFGFTKDNGEVLDLDIGYLSLKTLRNELAKVRDEGGNQQGPGFERHLWQTWDVKGDTDGRVKFTNLHSGEELEFSAGTLDAVLSAVDDAIADAEYDGRDAFIGDED